MFETLQEIDQIRINFDADGKLISKFAIAFVMFGVALELNISDFSRLFSNPKPVFVGILSQFLLMPLLTFCLAILLQDYITPTVGLGMILVAACPGGNISNFISALAKGNVALSVSLTAFSSLGGMILTPLNFAFWGNLFIQVYQNSEGAGLVRQLDIDVLNILKTIVLILGIPLVLGIIVNSKFPSFTAKIVTSIKRLSILIFIAMIVILFSMNFEYFVRFIAYIFVLVLIHNALALYMGYSTARLFGLSRIDRKTIAIETGIQNSLLALTLLFDPDIFPEDMATGGMMFIAGWWGIWHIISGLTLAGFWSGFSVSSKVEDS